MNPVKHAGPKLKRRLMLWLRIKSLPDCGFEITILPFHFAWVSGFSQDDSLTNYSQEGCLYVLHNYLLKKQIVGHLWKIIQPVNQWHDYTVLKQLRRTMEEAQKSYSYNLNLAAQVALDLRKDLAKSEHDLAVLSPFLFTVSRLLWPDIKIEPYSVATAQDAEEVVAEIKRLKALDK